MKDLLEKAKNDDLEEIEYEWKLVKPSQENSLKGFIISLIFFIVCILLILHSLLGVLITIFDFFIMIYYGYNLISKVGMGMPKRVPVEKEDKK